MRGLDDSSYLLAGTGRVLRNGLTSMMGQVLRDERFLWTMLTNLDCLAEGGVKKSGNALDEGEHGEF